MEWMIQTDQRSGFRHSISLDYGVSQSIPEGFSLLRQGGAPRDESPELPAEPRMNSAKAPPAAKEVLPVCQREILAKSLQLSITFLLAFNLALKGFNKPWNRDKHGDPLPPNCVD